MALNDMISVIHVVSDLHSSSGGPSRSIVQLTDSLGNNDDLLISIFSQKLINQKVINSANDNVISIVINTNSMLSHMFSIKSFFRIYKTFKKNRPSIVHSHGIWSLHNHWAVLLARRNNIPIIIHTRGMMMPNAFKFKNIKKNIAMSLFQKKDIESADVLIATSKAEQDSLRNYGFFNPIAVIPNGIDIENSMKISQRGDQLQDERERIILFLSRIHPIKGLINLIKAWSTIQTDGWKLRIAGPDNYGHLDEIVKLADDLGISDSIEYIGEVEEKDKRHVYQHADLFILPSYSENFGIVVLEALSYGIPVITTYGTPWSDLNKFNCGWWVECTEKSLAKTIKKAIRLDDSERNIMSLNANEYVKIYSWNSIANDTYNLYIWCLKKGEKPNFLDEV